MVALLASQPKVGPRVFTYVCERDAPARGDRPRRIKGQRYPLSNAGWYRKWKRALSDAGIEDFRFHDLRHTGATRLVRATGNLKLAMRQLGHADIATTARYAHATDDDVLNGLLAVESRNSPGRAIVSREISQEGKKIA
jgi:integrase